MRRKKHLSKWAVTKRTETQPTIGEAGAIPRARVEAFVLRNAS